MEVGIFIFYLQVFELIACSWKNILKWNYLQILSQVAETLTFYVMGKLCFTQ